ncbi:hypothetical protein FCU45_09020 [Sulfurimonas crateris]|uniref:Uncharacterized protein n=1 Tax=Sulfurimonas crateris TaxID=2574727 RepID=A0A4U2Z6K8_9BACT|nr:hypothetical protein [Sulfurimonas crateris]TKI69090.1 hypothetical protein FCU45_09020 [Sulfurimonas crateris]
MMSQTPTHTEDNAKYEKLQEAILVKFIKQTEDRLNSYEQRIENMIQTVGNVNELVLEITDIMYRTSSANTQLEIDAKISTALEKFELEQYSKKDTYKKPFSVLNATIAVLSVTAVLIVAKEILF